MAAPPSLSARSGAMTRTETLLAFDFGSQSIGVAAGTPGNGVATPLSTIRAFRSGPDWDSIDRLVQEWQPAAFVVGQAWNARGGHTAMSRRAARFGGRLKQRYHRPVHWVDETLSTEAARQSLRESGPERRPRKEDIDKTAAALILESYLNAQR